MNEVSESDYIASLEESVTRLAKNLSYFKYATAKHLGYIKDLERELRLLRSEKQLNLSNVEKERNES